MLTATEIAGFVGVGLAGAAYVPQIGHLVRQHCSAGVSRFAFGIWLIASSLVTTRAISMQATVFIVLGAIQIAATTVILSFATKYSSSYCASHAPPVLDLGTGTESWIVGDAVPAASIVTRSEEVSSMCLTCGCLLPHEDHGNPEYLTIEGLEKSAALNGYDLDTAPQNLIKTVDVAKKETEHDHQ